MKRSEVIKNNKESLMNAMIECYQDILEFGGDCQYKIFIWDDGELELLFGPQGDHSSLAAHEMEPRELYYVCTISEPHFDPWDCTDHSAPEDEAERETEKKEIIDWCVTRYKESVLETLNRIIDEAERDERLQKEMDDYLEENQ